MRRQIDDSYDQHDAPTTVVFLMPFIRYYVDQSMYGIRGVLPCVSRCRWLNLSEEFLIEIVVVSKLACHVPRRALASFMTLRPQSLRVSECILEMRYL